MVRNLRREDSKKRLKTLVSCGWSNDKKHLIFEIGPEPEGSAREREGRVTGATNTIVRWEQMGGTCTPTAHSLGLIS